MRHHNILRVAAAASVILLAVSACGSDDKGDDGKGNVKVLGTDGNTSQGFADNFKNDKGALAQMRGTTPLTKLSDDFQQRMLGVDPNIKDFNYSGEAYDAVVITALAAESARSSRGTDFAKYVNGVTTKGERCESFSACKALLAEGKDIDYDGVSGPLEFTEPGEPSVASFGVLSYSDDNKVSDNNPDNDVPDTEYIVAGDKSMATQTDVPLPPRDQTPLGGAFKVGALLSNTGGLAPYGPSWFGAVHLAVKEINEAGGVNNLEISNVDADDGTDPNVAGPAADTLLQADVDVIVGAAGSTVSKSVLEKITGAGVVMISPSNTSDEFTTISDNGLYFRTAPPDVLQSKPLANLVLEDGADRVAVLYQNTAYGEGLAKNVQKNLIAGDVPEKDVLLIAYDEKGRDFSTEVNKAAEHKPEYVLVIGYDESQSIVKKLNEKGIGPKR